MILAALTRWLCDAAPAVFLFGRPQGPQSSSLNCGSFISPSLNIASSQVTLAHVNLIINLLGLRRISHRLSLRLPLQYDAGELR